MQILRTLVLLAAVSDVALAGAGAVDAVEGRPHKKHERVRHSTSGTSRASRRALRRASSDRESESTQDSEWATQEGGLHLQAAEVETEAVEDIAKVESQDEKEEHPELAQAEDAARKQVETQAADEWAAVAQAASAQAVRLKQEAEVHHLAGAAPGAAPAPGPAAPADFSWAHKMDVTKPLPEQGFEGQTIQHVDFDTMTEDWHKEHVQSWNTIHEICKACARHPENTWCKGKCPGMLATGAAAADDAAADVAEVQPPAPVGGGGGGGGEKEGGVFGKDGIFGKGGIFGEDGIFGKDGAIFGEDGIFGKDGLGGIFGSGALGRSLGLGVCLLALMPNALE